MAIRPAAEFRRESMMTRKPPATQSRHPAPKTTRESRSS